MDDKTELPDVLELPGATGLKLLAHAARQQVIGEIYDGRDLTATEAAELTGLTPSAMSYHLRMLEKAGVIAQAPATGDGRERRYRRVAKSLQISGPQGSRAELQATVLIWIDSLSKAANRWLSAGGGGRGGIFTESLRLTAEQNAEFMDELAGLYRRYADLSERNGASTPRWESYWAHLPRTNASDAG